jgi:hypothetical protein
LASQFKLAAIQKASRSPVLVQMIKDCFKKVVEELMTSGLKLVVPKKDLDL